MSAAMYEIALHITLRSPFLMPGAEAAAYGLDAVHLRDGSGRLVVPGDHIKGLLRLAVEEVLEAQKRPSAEITQMIVSLFGPPPEADEAASDGPTLARGALSFSDLVAEAPKETSDITRIEIDDTSGAVREGHLQVAELVAPMGADIRFSGKAIALGCKLPAAELQTLLDAGLRLIRAVGAHRTIGFGEVVHVEAKCVERSLAFPPVPADPVQGDWHVFDVTFDRPLLVDAERRAANLFVGASVIPGGVFKGALARMLNAAGISADQGELGAALAAMVFHHAFPIDADGRVLGLPLPQSLLLDEKETVLADALERQEAGYLIGGKAAKFQTDWKESAKGRDLMAGNPLPGFSARHRIRTRTRIDSGYGTAYDGALFAMMALETAGVTWRLTVDTSALSGRSAELAQQLLAFLAKGLFGIGKTEAIASFSRQKTAAPPNISPLDDHHPDCFAVTLLTPCLMIDPARADDGAQRAYGRYWKAALGEATELVNFMATQRFAGGYQAMRFRAYGSTRYGPFILTEPGSVFLLRGAIAEKLGKAVRRNLPPIALGPGALTWRNCPFVPENGYGAFRTNLVDHAGLAQGVTYVQA